MIRRLCHYGPLGCEAVESRACLEVGPAPTANGPASLWGNHRPMSGYYPRLGVQSSTSTCGDAFRQTLLGDGRLVQLLEEGIHLGPAHVAGKDAFHAARLDRDLTGNQKQGPGAGEQVRRHVGLQA